MIHTLVAESRDFSAEATQVLTSLGQCDLCELDRGQLLPIVADYDVLWVRLGITIDRQVLDAGTRLKVVVTPTTGLDHIDMECANQRRIKVLSLQGERDFLDSIPATAELTWGLLLALNRRIPWAFASVCKGEWDRHRFRGNDLRSQTLGIVGLGRLGVQVAGFALAFGMRVVAFDPYRTTWPTDVMRCSTLQELLRMSHVVTLHVPLNEETTGLIGCRELQFMPAGGILLNTSRGAIVESDALLEALSSRHLRGAALDVVPNERRSDSAHRQRLIDYAAKHDHLIITPHIGGATYESMAATEFFMSQKLLHHFENHGIETAVGIGRVPASSSQRF